MRSPQVDRELAEMVAELSRQLRVLQHSGVLAFGPEQNADYLPEVATKLRSLLVRSRMNTPLSREVASWIELPRTITLGARPLLKAKGDPSPGLGNTISLDRFFDLIAIAVRTARRMVPLTKRDIIRAWCEQLDRALPHPLAAALGERAAASVSAG
jgi:hypothetical protein